jgi:DNA-binding PadR family transcriptional regulator
VYRPSPGALYPALRRLLKRGLLSVEDTVSAGHRPQRLYQATEAGLAVHLEWFRQPVDPATVANDLGLHLMRFALMEDYVERPRVIAYLKELASALDAFIADMEHYLATDGKSARLHGHLAMKHGIETHRASLDWARTAIATLTAAKPPAEPSARFPVTPDGDSEVPGGPVTSRGS